MSVAPQILEGFRLPTTPVMTNWDVPVSTFKVKLETARSWETLVSHLFTTRFHNPEDDWN